MLAKLRLMPEELQSRRFDTVSQLIARQLLANQGVMIIENAFAPEFIETARRDFMKRYESCLVDPFWSTSTQSGEPAWSRRFAPDGTEMLRVGHRRVMIPIGPSGLSTAGGPDLYANPFIMELIRELLGDDCLLGSFCVVVAFPGAEAQHIHRDHPLLFGDPSLDVAIPPYAINVMVPLGRSHRADRAHSSLADEPSRVVRYGGECAPVRGCHRAEWILLLDGLPPVARRSEESIGRAATTDLHGLQPSLVPGLGEFCDDPGDASGQEGARRSSCGLSIVVLGACAWSGMWRAGR